VEVRLWDAALGVPHEPVLPSGKCCQSDIPARMGNSNTNAKKRQISSVTLICRGCENWQGSRAGLVRSPLQPTVFGPHSQPCHRLVSVHSITKVPGDSPINAINNSLCKLRSKSVNITYSNASGFPRVEASVLALASLLKQPIKHP
jgi:hypothetical protein